MFLFQMGINRVVKADIDLKILLSLGKFFSFIPEQCGETCFAHNSINAHVFKIFSVSSCSSFSSLFTSHTLCHHPRMKLHVSLYLKRFWSSSKIVEHCRRQNEKFSRVKWLTHPEILRPFFLLKMETIFYCNF